MGFWFVMMCCIFLVNDVCDMLVIGFLCGVCDIDIDI